MQRQIKGPVVLVVLDGWGLREETAHNGIALARTPRYDEFTTRYSHTILHAAGEHVGLPEGQMGNSEVGHTTIGAGHVIYQDLVRIGKDIADERLADNMAFATVFDHVKERGSQLHIIGLLSPGGVHSHEDHFHAVLSAAVQAGVARIVVHPFLDGRDTPKTSGLQSLERLERLLRSFSGTVIGSVSGRYYAMDRDTNWNRTDKAFAAIFNGQADHIYSTEVPPSRIIAEWYHNEVFDEHLEPMVFHGPDGKPLEVRDHDGIIFTNFRKDRAKQLAVKICNRASDQDLCFVTMTDYGKEIDALVAYKPEVIRATIGGVISQAGLKQAHITETEKFPHATYYLNGGRQEPYPGEEDVLIPSRKDIKTHDQAPEMRAREITDAALSRLDNDFIFINYANPDMVGHTANEPAILVAIETVDRELGRLVDAVLARNGAVLVIADHGNAETMVDPGTGAPHTSHTTNPVPCILIHETYQPKLRSHHPGLRDVGPTVLQLLGLPKPDVMSGISLIS